MYLFVDLNEFKKLFEMVDSEIALSEKIEQRLLEKIGSIAEADTYQIDFIKRQIHFSQELTEEFKQKRNLLENIFELFLKSKDSSTRDIDDALKHLKML